MRSRLLTRLSFALRFFLCLFYPIASGFMLYAAIFETSILPLRLLLGLSCFYGVCYATVIGTSVFYDMRNLVRGLPLTTLIAVEANHGCTIDEVGANICKEPVEYLAVFTEDGQKLTEITNFHPAHVYNPARVIKLYAENPGFIKIHNHPCRDLPPSPADLHAAMFCGASRTIVVTPNSTYEFVLPRRYTAAEARQARALLDRVGGLLTTDYKRQLHACEQVAAEFGLTFLQHGGGGTYLEGVSK